jgi:hypothetical protein
MKLFFTSLILILFSFSAKSQLHMGINSGSTSWIGAQIGYSLSEDLHLGVSLHPSFDAANFSGFYGGYARKTFTETELFSIGDWQWTMRPLVFATVGVIPGITTMDLNSSYQIVNNTTNSEIGGCLGGGIELLWGKNAKVATPIELGIGKMPSVFSSIGSIVNQTQKTTSLVYFNTGIRLYLGSRN